MDNKLKENDWLFTQLANPQMDVNQFEGVGLNARNTSLETEDKYKEVDAIKNNPMFLTDGVFDDNKFHKFYEHSVLGFTLLANDTFQDDLISTAKFYKNDIFAPVQRAELMNERSKSETQVMKVANPYKTLVGTQGLGSVIASGYSDPELMQQNRILLNAEDVDFEKGDFSKAKWGDSADDMALYGKDGWNFGGFFGNLATTYIESRWKEDGTHIDPVTGVEVEHKKGETRYDQDGNMFYEKLNGRSVYGERVLSKWDYLTVDGTKVNEFDFFDSDDVKKSVGGTLVRSVFNIAPMFIPYVGLVYLGTRLALQLGNLMATVGKMASDVSGHEVPFLNDFIGFNKALEFSTSEYSQNKNWTWENILNLANDVVGQLVEQRYMMNAIPKLKFKRTDALSDKHVKELHAKYIEEYLTKRQLQGLGFTDEIMDMAQNYASGKIKELTKVAQEFGGELSRVYMTGITVADSYGEALENGATPAEAALLTLGYAAGEYGILKTDIGNWILPELKAEKQHLKQVIKALEQGGKRLDEATDPVEKLSIALKLLRFGNRVAHADYSGTKMTAESIFANALGEGIEETSEELLADLTKQLGNLTISPLFGNGTDFKPWEGADTRYAQSFLGGFLGGGIGQLDPTYIKQTRKDKNMSYDAALQEAIYIVGEGKANDLLKTIDKLPLSNSYLVNDIGGEYQTATGLSQLDMDKVSKDMLKSTITTILDILDSHYAGISAESALNQNLDFLRDLRASKLSNVHRTIGNETTLTSFASFLQDFNTKRTELVTAELALKKLTTPSKDTFTDENRNEWMELHKTDIENARLAVKKADEAIRPYLDGSKTPELVRQTIKEMSPTYMAPYETVNEVVFAESYFGAPYSTLDAKLKKEARTKWEEYKNSAIHKSRMLMADLLSHKIAMMLKPVLDNVQEQYLDKVDQDSYNILNDVLEYLNRNLGIISDETSLYWALSRQEGFTPEAFDYQNEFMQRAAAFTGRTAEMSETPNVVGIDTPQFQLLSRIAENDNQTKADLDAFVTQVKNGNIVGDAQFTKLQEILNKAVIKNMDKVIDPLVKQGFAHPLVKQLAVKTLDNVITSNKEEIKQIEERIAALEANESRTEDENSELAVLNENLASIQQSLTELQLKKTDVLALSNVPILQILDQFLLSITDPNMTISKVIELADKLLDAPALALVSVPKNLKEAIELAEKVIQIFDSQLMGAANDNVDGVNAFSLNATINELESKYNVPQEQRSNLPEISSETATILKQSMIPILLKLRFVQALSDMNSGTKIKELSRTAARAHHNMYSKFKTKLLGHDDIFDDSWNEEKDENGVGALDRLNTAIDGLSLLSQLSEIGYDLDDTQKRQLEKERIQFEDAIYEFFKANSKKDIKEKAKIFTHLNFADPENLLLNGETVDLSDHHFAYWLISRAVLKSSEFVNDYKTAFKTNPSIAPIISLELGVHLAYATILKGDKTALWVAALGDVIADKVKTIPEYLRGNDLLIGDGSDPYETNINPRFLRTVLIEGVPGSGKSTGIAKTIVALLKANHNDTLLKNAWVAHIGLDEALNFSKDIGLDSAQTFDREKLMAMITADAYQTSKLKYDKEGNVDYGLLPKSGNFYKLPVGIADLDPKSLPSILFIDEIGRFTTMEMDLLDEFAEKYGITIVALGDLDLTKTVATASSTKEALDEGKPDLKSSLYRGNFIHAPKLGISIRANNNLKQDNLKVFQTTLESLYNLEYSEPGKFYSKVYEPVTSGALLKVKFKYYQDNSGLYGERLINLTKPLRRGVKPEDALTPDVKETLAIMFRTSTDKKIGYTYTEVPLKRNDAGEVVNDSGEVITDPEEINKLHESKQSVLWQYLRHGTYVDVDGTTKNFWDKLEVFAKGLAQGKEGLYYIVEPLNTLESTPASFWRDLYTGMSRSKLGSLVFINYNTAQVLYGLDEQYIDGEEPLELTPQQFYLLELRVKFKVSDPLTESIINDTLADRESVIDSALEGLTLEGTASMYEKPKNNKLATKVIRPKKTGGAIVKGEKGTFKPGRSYGVNKRRNFSFLAKVKDEKEEFNLFTYSFNTHETGFIEDASGVHIVSEDAFNSRIDGYNGIAKLLGYTAALVSDPTVIARLASVLEQLRENAFYGLDYDTLHKRLKEILGDIEAFKNGYSIRIGYKKAEILDDNTIVDRLSYSSEESLINLHAIGEAAKGVRPAKISMFVTVPAVDAEGHNYNEAVLEIPLLTLPNIATILLADSLIKEADGKLNALGKIWVEANKTAGIEIDENTGKVKLVPDPDHPGKMMNQKVTGQQEVIRNKALLKAFIDASDISNTATYIPGALTLAAVVGLYIANPNSPFVVYADENTTLTLTMEASGPFINPFDKGKSNYEHQGWETYNLDGKKPIPINEFAKDRGLVMSPVYASFNASSVITVNGVSFQWADPGSPFVLISDRTDLSPEGLKAAFLELLELVCTTMAEHLFDGLTADEIEAKKKELQILDPNAYYDNNLTPEGRRIKLIYVVPPTATALEYGEYLIKLLNNVDDDTLRPIGNDFTAFRILALDGMKDFLSPKKDDGTPYAPDSVEMKKHERVFELVEKLSNLDKQFVAAEEEGDFLKMNEISSQMLTLLSGDDFSKSGDKPFNNKYTLQLAIAKGISKFKEGTAHEREIISDRLNQFVLLMDRAKAGSIYYNAIADQSDPDAMTNDIIPIKVFEDKPFTVNGKFDTLVMYGNATPLLTKLFDKVTKFLTDNGIKLNDLNKAPLTNLPDTLEFLGNAPVKVENLPTIGEWIADNRGSLSDAVILDAKNFFNLSGDFDPMKFAWWIRYTNRIAVVKAEALSKRPAFELSDYIFIGSENSVSKPDVALAIESMDLIGPVLYGSVEDGVLKLAQFVDEDTGRVNTAYEANFAAGDATIEFSEVQGTPQVEVQTIWPTSFDLTIDMSDTESSNALQLAIGLFAESLKNAKFKQRNIKTLAKTLTSIASPQDIDQNAINAFSTIINEALSFNAEGDPSAANQILDILNLIVAQDMPAELKPGLEVISQIAELIKPKEQEVPVTEEPACGSITIG